MSRYKAFGIHFCISLLVFAALLYVIVFIWYPDFFFEIDGGWEGLRIIIGVDLVLGPLLTLIVYKAGKPGLKTDLTLIGVFQTVCLAGGMWVVHSERPLALIFVDGHFYSMSAGSYADLEHPVPNFDNFSGPLPKRLQISIPEDPVEQSKLRGDAFTSGTPLRLLTELYQPFKFVATDLANEYPLAKIRERDLEFGELANWQADHPGALQDYAFFPLGTRYKYLFMGFRRDSLEFSGLLRTPGPL